MTATELLPLGLRTAKLVPQGDLVSDVFRQRGLFSADEGVAP